MAYFASMQKVSEHPFAARAARLYRLDNGLQLITYVDPQAPVFAYQTWFAVGSRHEREGTTGIAHLFEHLMFNQTESHPPGEFDRLLESVGGETNAATWVDWTYYRDSLPAGQLELAVSLESERMSRLVLGDRQVESEREVVANERRFRVEDDVDGFLSEEMYRLAFTVHPYHWPTIGWMSDIHAISIADCRAFYRTYYAPNNATLVVVGDFDEARALALVERYYGSLAAQPIPEDRAPAEPEQTAERRAHFTKPVMADKLRLGYKSPPLTDDDYPPLEVACEILLGGNSSRLHRALVAESEIASSAHVSLSPFRDPGLCEIAVALQREHAAGEAEQRIDVELATLGRERPGTDELETAKTRLETRFWRELRPQSGKAEALGHYHTTAGDYRRLFGVAEALRRVTDEDVMRVAARYLVPERRTVVTATAGEDEGEEE
jgi:zinc protease